MKEAPSPLLSGPEASEYPARDVPSLTENQPKTQPRLRLSLWRMQHEDARK